MGYCLILLKPKQVYFLRKSKLIHSRQKLVVERVYRLPRVGIHWSGIPLAWSFSCLRGIFFVSYFSLVDVHVQGCVDALASTYIQSRTILHTSPRSHLTDVTYRSKYNLIAHNLSKLLSYLVSLSLLISIA